MGNCFPTSAKKSSVKQPQENLGTQTCQGASSRQETILPSKKTSETNNWAAKDTEKYRKRYPGKKDHPKKRDNWLFYTNQLKAKPDGEKIDEIHDKWSDNYKKLEQGHHGYIQWLFPNRMEGVNNLAQELQLHEIKAILQDTTAKKRVLTSYKLMLIFYGMRLKDEETGEIEREENWQERFLHLNKSSHLNITRILKCLGELEYEHLKAPFVRFILNEGLVHKTLNLGESCEEYWIGVIRDDAERKSVMNYYEKAKYKKTEEEIALRLQNLVPDELIPDVGNVEDSTEGLTIGNDIKEADNIANGTTHNTVDEKTSAVDVNMDIKRL